MFPLKVAKVNEDGTPVSFSRGSSSTLIRNGLIALLVLVIFVTPYVVNFEILEKDSPGQNLDEFLNKMNGDQAAAGITAQSEGLESADVMPDVPPAEMPVVPAGSLDPNGETGDPAVTSQDSAESKKAKRLRQKAEAVSLTIYGCKIDQKVGKQIPGKQCVVFYADDPEVVEDVVSTKICPDERDRHIEFHMKGIFSSHPHAPGQVDTEPVRVRYIHSGPLVWTSFFQQHDDKHENIVVPPGITTDIKYLTTGHDEDFQLNFDSVRVLHTTSYVSKTKGHQAAFPTCAQFYEAKIVDTKTKGFMICQEPKKNKAEYPLEKLEKNNVSPQNADTNGITSIYAGNEVTVYGYSGKELDGDSIVIQRGTSVDLTQAKRTDKDGKEIEDSTWNKKVKSLKLKWSSSSSSQLSSLGP